MHAGRRPGGGRSRHPPGATLELAFTGTRTIASLTLGGIPQPSGTHGSTVSPASNKNDSYFSATGTVTVAPNWAKDILSGKDIRYSHETTLEGTNLCVWLRLESVQPVRLRLNPR